MAKLIVSINAINRTHIAAFEGVRAIGNERAIDVEIKSIIVAILKMRDLNPLM